MAGVAAAFVGHWTCTDIRGDFNQVLRAQNVPWRARRRARMQRYGKRREEEWIDVTGDYITITNNCIGFKKPVTSDVRLCASCKQEMRSIPDGRAISAQVS